VIFLTAVMRIAIAFFIWIRSASHQRMQMIAARNTKKRPQARPQINPVWNPESWKSSGIFIWFLRVFGRAREGPLWNAPAEGVNGAKMI
jgi:hypothetical protein